MGPMHTNRGEEVTGGDNPPSDISQETPFTPRRSDRRSEIDLFGGYNGPERRSGSDRRQRLSQ